MYKIALNKLKKKDIISTQEKTRQISNWNFFANKLKNVIWHESKKMNLEIGLPFEMSDTKNIESVADADFIVQKLQSSFSCSWWKD